MRGLGEMQIRPLVRSAAWWHEEIPVRMAGANVTFSRTAWATLLDDLDTEGTLYRRVREACDFVMAGVR